MKKLLTVSLVAMMAVTTARAEIASKAYVDQQDGQLSSLKTTAKNNLVAAINELSDKAGETSVADQIAAALEDYTETGEDENYAPANVLENLNYTSTGDGVVTAVNQTNGAVSATKAKITNTEIADNAAIADSKIAKSGSVAANDGGLVTGGDVYTAVEAAKTANTTALNGLNLTNPTGDGVITAISQTNGQVSATRAQITDTEVASNAAIADSKIAKSGSVASENTGLVTGGQVYTAVEAAKTASVANLDVASTAEDGKVVVGVSQADGVVSATMADPLSVTSYNVGVDGKYALTAVASGGKITGYEWELISRTGSETAPASGY